MKWNGNKTVFKGYATGDGKKPNMKVSGKLLTWDDVKDSDSFGAVLNGDYVDISFDSDELSEKFWKMSGENNWNCLILENPTNGHIHSYWKNTEGKIKKSGQDKKLAVGLVADIHFKGTYIPLKVDGVERFPPLFEPDEIDEVPDELVPVSTNINLKDLTEGEGRNTELFKYILILQSKLGFDKETIRRVLKNTNDFVFSDPLPDKELEVITRDESFNLPVFFVKDKFMHNVFAQYLISEYHIKRINGQLHVYTDGVYREGGKFIEAKMIEVIPTLKSAQRNETMKYIEVLIPEDTPMADARYIGCRNGIYDILQDKLIPFSPDIIITNKIPWDYNPDAYDKLCDDVLNKISCGKHLIRRLLEECVGYCLFRKNELSKSFFLTGSGSNGKSTFLDMIKNLLGRYNYSALDMDEMYERFSVATMNGKLANIGDDINDDFLQGKALSQFKKIVSGNQVKAENKNDPNIFFYKPYVKLLFSANEIPRMRNKGFYAIKRRLVIIPFKAQFSKDDPDYDPLITWKLCSQESAEYLLLLGIKALKRILENNGFTECPEVEEEINAFEKENNSLLQWLDEVEEEEILNHEVKEVYLRYDSFCSSSNYTALARQAFTKEINRIFNCESRQSRLSGGIRASVFKR